MRSVLSRGRLVAGLLCALAVEPVAGSQQPAASPPPEQAKAKPLPRLTLALTFDDLPVHAALPPGVSRADVVRGVLEALAEHKAPQTYGFVNGKGLTEAEGNAEVLRLWRAAGHPLANHTFSHLDLHGSAPEAFERDVLDNEATLRSYMDGQDWRWLRYPYLHEGETLEKRRRVSRFLRENGYRVAQVTLSFDDYAYNDPYARCAAKGDTAGIGWMKERFLRRAEASIAGGQQAAQRVYGRDIAHVLLLHIGAFDSVMLGELLELLERRGVELVTLPEAQSDPAYAMDPGRASVSGATLLDQMATARGIALLQEPDDTLARLAGLCR